MKYKSEGKRIFLIDANSLIHRAFHALPPLTSPQGAPVQAIYGVASILVRLWREEKPEYAAACFDRPEPTFRKERYTEYKAHRPKAPDELITQIIEVHRLFGVFGIPVYEAAGWEADDCIATAAERLKNDALVIILTGDLDALQLVEDPNVTVWALKTGISEVMKYNNAAVRARYGLDPKQLPDYKALVGDPSDNVKGVPGIGPKTAAAFLKQFGTLENLFAAAPREEKVRAKLLPYLKEAEFAKMLVTLRKDAPLSIETLDSLKVAANLDAAREYFESLGFKALLKRMGEKIVVEDVPTKSTTPIPLQENKSLPSHTIILGEIPRNLPAGLKVGFELKVILQRAWREGKDIVPPYWDLGVAAWLLDPDAKSFEATTVAKRLLNQFWSGSSEEYEHLFRQEYRLLRESGAQSILETIEMPLMRVLAEMEAKGIVVSKDRLTALLEKVQDRLRILEKEIYVHAGETFNLNSPREVGRILFEKLGIEGGATTRTGLRSTREEALLAVKDVHPVVEKILEYREFFKMQSTYLAPLGEHIKEDGRVHTEFVQTGTGTGRLSSRNPNLQNIPQGFIWAKELRGAFVVPEGFSLLACDYTQLELRILAALSGDAELIAAFRRRDDLHRLTAARVLGVPVEKVGDKERRLAKTLNFGLMYGMGARAFAEAAEVKLEEAKKFIAQYFRTFARVKEWQESIKSFARGKGYVQSLTGRRRYLEGIRGGAPRFRAEAERAAINFPIQGLGADIIKLAMICVRDCIQREGWEISAAMLLSIHDELLFEIRDDMIAKIAPKLVECMESSYPLAVPLTVKASVGKDWGHLQEIHG